MTHPRLIPHHPEVLATLRRPSVAEPLRVLVSACLQGRPCGVNGSDYGLGTALGDLPTLRTVAVAAFCPEEHALGTPRAMPDLHGGDGWSVLAGEARVRDEHGVDLTDAMLDGARAMLAFALAQRVEVAILTDMSAACGTQVISDGCRLVAVRRFRPSVGVASALLLRAGIPCVSQRDARSLGALRALLDPGFSPDPTARDHHETPWYRATFGAGGTPLRR